MTKYKAIINLNGYLHIDRGDGLKQQLCPFSVELVEKTNFSRVNNQRGCGTWCPLFGTPKQTISSESKSTFTLTLCQKTWVFDELIDYTTSKQTTEKGDD